MNIVDFESNFIQVDKKLQKSLIGRDTIDSPANRSLQLYLLQSYYGETMKEKNSVILLNLKYQDNPETHFQKILHQNYPLDIGLSQSLTNSRSHHHVHHNQKNQSH